MRITGGALGGRKIEVPSNFTSRPTTDISREALFNILSNRVDFEELRVLDLFSGTGSIIYEFYSRGTRQIEGVEINRKHVAYIWKNFENLKIHDVKVFCADAIKYLNRCSPRTYDIVFADPPFDFSRRFEIPEYVFQREILKSDGILILEHEPLDNYTQHPRWKETRHYGKVNFSFFQ